MPTVVKGAPVASRIPPHENRAKPRVVPDEDPAELLRRVAPDENLAESLRRVAPDENQAELLRRVVPNENQAKSLCTSLLMSIAAASHHKSLPIRIAAASTRCSARYENRVPPDPYAKPYRQAGLQARTIHRNNTYGFSAQMSSPWADNQSPSGKNALEKQTAESKRLRSRKKQRFIFLFYHTKAGKATTGRNANMQFVYTAGQAEKQSTVA